MAVKQSVTYKQLPFGEVSWKGAVFYTSDLAEEGWEFTLVTQPKWRSYGKHDYYYLREPTSRTLLRVTVLRGSKPEWCVDADFYVHEKRMRTTTPMVQVEDEHFNSTTALADASIEELLDEVIKRQPKAKRRSKDPAPVQVSTNVVDFMEYVSKYLAA